MHLCVVSSYKCTAVYFDRFSVLWFRFYGGRLKLEGMFTRPHRFNVCHFEFGLKSRLSFLCRSSEQKSVWTARVRSLIGYFTQELMRLFTRVKYLPCRLMVRCKANIWSFPHVGGFRHFGPWLYTVYLFLQSNTERVSLDFTYTITGSDQNIILCVFLIRLAGCLAWADCI